MCFKNYLYELHGKRYVYNNEQVIRTESLCSCIGKLRYNRQAGVIDEIKELYEQYLLNVEHKLYQQHINSYF